MLMSRCCPLMAIVPISLFLTASFFVLFTLAKVVDKKLKLLGYLAVGFLWLAALVILSGAVSNLSQGFTGLRCSMPQKMQRCGMMQMMQQNNAPEMATSGKVTTTK